MKFSSSSPENLGHSKSKPQPRRCVSGHPWEYIYFFIEHGIPLPVRVKRNKRDGYNGKDREETMIVVMKRNETNQSMWHVSS